jgi:hypothetical protein
MDLRGSELIVRLIKLFAAVVVLVAFASCTDSPVTFWGDLDPPYGGWLWVVETDYGELKKVRPSDGEIIESYVTPFDSNRSYEAAAGDGRVWVGGFDYFYEYDDYYDCIWELGHSSYSYYYSVHSGALTYDGENLWVAGQEYDYPSKTFIRFYRVDPNTHEYEMAFEIEGDYDNREYPHGLAWDSGYIWCLIGGGEFQTREICRINPTDGEILHTIRAPSEDPRGLTWDGEALWVNDIYTNMVYRVSPKTGDVLGYIYLDPGDRQPPARFNGLAFEFPSE